MQLGTRRSGYVPSAFSMVDVPGNLINNHMITNEDKLAACVAKAMSAAHKLNGNWVVVSVPEAKSFVRIINMPKMDVAEVEGALPWELEHDIPVPVEQVYLDWRIVAETDDKIKILAMASPRDYIDSLLQVLRLAKLKPVAMELESQSTARAAISAVDKDQSVLMVDIAGSSTSFAIVSKTVLEYTSSIPSGGTAITESIASELKITPAEAEKLKQEAGLVGESKKGNVKQSIIPVLDGIIDEIRNVIKYHDDHALFDQSITKVILAGGGAKLPGITDYIMARLNVGVGKSVEHVVLCDPWANVADPSQRAGFPDNIDALEYATAIGLALRGMEWDENH